MIYSLKFKLECVEKFLNGEYNRLLKNKTIDTLEKKTRIYER